MTPSAKRSRRTDVAQRPVADLARHLHEVSGTVIDEPLLLRALTHRSYSYEHGSVPHNERQEFLGDSVLGLVVTDHLFAAHPDLPEGQLAKLRASVVNSRALAGVARGLHLGEYVLLGRGEAGTGGRDKDSILADTMEAVIGTVYLCGGMPASDRFVHHLLDPLLLKATTLGAGLDWKTSLQEAVAAAELGAPQYQVAGEGPDHDKVFTAVVLVGGRELGHGTGRNKKAAEQLAAQQAWHTLAQEPDAEPPAPRATDSAAAPRPDAPAPG